MSVIPEPPDNVEHELREVVEDEKAEAEQESDPRLAQLREDILRTSASATATASQMELRTFHDSGLHQAQNGSISLAREAIADGGNAEVSDLDAQRRRLAVEVAALDQGRKDYNLQRFMAGFGILSTATGLAALLYSALKPTNGVASVPEELRTDVAALVRQWWSMSDEQYWTSLAIYADVPQTPELTLTDQVLFMNYTMDLAPEFDPWLWESSADFMRYVDALTVEYAQNGNRTSAMYRHVIGLEYLGRVVPRAIAADLLDHALVKIIVQVGVDHGA